MALRTDQHSTRQRTKSSELNDQARKLPVRQRDSTRKARLQDRLLRSTCPNDVVAHNSQVPHTVLGRIRVIASELDYLEQQ